MTSIIIAAADHEPRSTPVVLALGLIAHALPSSQLWLKTDLNTR